MAEDNLDKPSFFGIESTMEMGAGNPELIQGLLAPETSTSNPDDIKKLEDEEPKKVEKKVAPVKKAEVKKAKTEEEEEEEEEDNDEPTESESDKLRKALLGEEESEENDEEEGNKKPENSSEDDEEESTTESKFSALAKDLLKLNVFTKDEDEEDIQINTPEEFLERFNYEKQKGAIQTIENFIGQFGDDYKQAFEAIFVKGVNPKDYFGTYNKIDSFSELDLANEDNQKAVVRQALLDQGFDEEDIASEIERFKNYGDLEAIAQKHHKVLVKKEAAKLAQMEQESQAKLQREQATKQLYVNNVQTVLQDKIKAKDFDGIPINPKLANELQDFLLVDKYKTPTGEKLTEFDRFILDLKKPENHAMKVKVALLLKTLEKDPTLSTIQRAGITKKTDTLFGEVSKHVEKSPSKQKQAPSKWFN